MSDPMLVPALVNLANIHYERDELVEADAIYEKAIRIDPECFEDSFPKWKEMAVAARRNFQRSGVLALECQINPEEFFAWCALNNQENNATSRGEFVSEKLSAAHESKA